MMKQPHTEGAVDHTDGEQDTGNHRASTAKPPTPGGTRVGAQNVEPASTSAGANAGEAGTDDELDDSVSVNGPVERDAERDERGRL